MSSDYPSLPDWRKYLVLFPKITFEGRASNPYLTIDSVDPRCKELRMTKKV